MQKTSCSDKLGQCRCSEIKNKVPVYQNLEELSFERGIWNAALNGEYERGEALLRKGVPASDKDTAGYTALHYASRSGHLSFCQLLLTHGADVNAQTPGGNTSLHRASLLGHTKVVKLLLEKGADPELVDDDGKNSLHKAAEGKQLEVARLLLNHLQGLKFIRDKRGRYPVDLLPAQGKDDLYKLLLP